MIKTRRMEDWIHGDERPDNSQINPIKDVEGLPDNEFITDDVALQDKALFTWPDSVRTVLKIL